LATIKRKARVSNRGGGLTEGQFAELYGGSLIFLSKDTSSEPDPLFIDDEHRKQAYFANRGSLIKRAIEYERPGFRPEGFWNYEAELREGEGRHEYLIKNDLLYPGELDQIIAEWLHSLNAHSNGLQGRYKTYKEGGKVYHGPEWPAEADKWTREAELYGGRALKAWEKLLAEIESGGE
jgi:hypothetical protein